eukprot:7716749-Pyramimonas_sp.AAC.1
MLDHRGLLGPRAAHSISKQVSALGPIRRMCSRFSRMSLPAKTNLVDTMANVHLMYLVEIWEHAP